jgi:hypothetical protein
MGDLEKDGWMIINLVLRKTMCDVIRRSVVSSGGLFEHGDELSQKPENSSPAH